MDKMTKPDTVKLVVWAILSIAAIITTIASYDARLAKVKTVEKLHEKIDSGTKSNKEQQQLNIINQQVTWQQQDVDRYKAMARFEKRKEPVSQGANEIIVNEEKKLKALKQRRMDKIDQIEARE